MSEAKTHILGALLRPHQAHVGRLAALRYAHYLHGRVQYPALDGIMLGPSGGPLGPVLFIDGTPAVPQHLHEGVRDQFAAVAVAALPALQQQPGAIIWLQEEPVLQAALDAGSIVPGLSPYKDEFRYVMTMQALRPHLEERTVLEYDAPAFPWSRRISRARADAFSFESAAAAAAAADLGWTREPSGEPDALLFHSTIDEAALARATRCTAAFWIGSSEEADDTVRILKSRFSDVRRFAVNALNECPYWMPDNTGVVEVVYGSDHRTVWPVPNIVAPKAPTLRVLYVRPPWMQGNAVGGVEVESRATQQWLHNLGVDVRETYEPNFSSTGFDVVHIWQGTHPNVNLSQIASARASSAKVVVTPIYADISGYHWFCASQESILGAPLSDAVAERSATFVERTNAIGNAKPPPDTRDPRDVHAMRSVLLQADHLFVHAYAEARELWRATGVTRPFTMIPSGFDPHVMHPDVAANPLVPRRPYVLMSGRFENQKNLIGTALAARDLPIDVVFVGRPWSETPEAGRAFVSQLSGIAGHNCVFLPPLAANDPWLAGLHAHASAVLVTSWTEVFSLTALNAAACAVPLITSHGGYHAEHFGSIPYYVDPADTHAIRAAIIQAIEERESRREDRLALAYRLREEYRWEAVASKTLKAYRALVGQS